MAERLAQFLQIDNQPGVRLTPSGRRRQLPVIGHIGGGKKTISGLVDVALMPSLVSHGQVNPLVNNYGMIIVDECHHLSAYSFEQILKTSSAKYVYGLTATLHRRDGHEPLITMQCGPVVYDARQRSSSKHILHKRLIPRWTTFSSQEEQMSRLYSELACDAQRNSQIVADILQVVAEGRQPLVLTERRAQVELLAQQLPDCQVIKLIGTTSSKKRKQLHSQLLQAKNTPHLVIIATGKYAGEGFDWPQLDTLFLAAPVSWRGLLEQYVGRLHRPFPGKKEVIVYDYIDLRTPVLERMYYKRLRTYKQLDYQLQVINNKQNSEMIFDELSYQETFWRDISQAKKEIIIVSPAISKKNSQRLLSTLTLSPKRVTIIARTPEQFHSVRKRQTITNIWNELQTAGICIQAVGSCLGRWVVIDRQLVWYGDICWLADNKSTASAIRFTNTAVAASLTASVTSQADGLFGQLL